MRRSALGTQQPVELPDQDPLPPVPSFHRAVAPPALVPLIGPLAEVPAPHVKLTLPPLTAPLRFPDVPVELVKLPDAGPSLLTTRFHLPVARPVNVPQYTVTVPPAFGTKRTENLPVRPGPD